MAEKYKLFVADMDEYFRARMAKCAADTGELEVVGSSGDGRLARLAVLNLHPDVLLTSLALSHLDGLSLLEQVRDLPPETRPVCAMASVFTSRESVTMAARLGACLYMVKPCDCALLARRLVSVARLRAEELAPVPVIDLEKVAGDLLAEMGFGANLVGTLCLRKTANLFMDDPDMLKAVTKEIYPVVASKMGMSRESVESSIRRAVSAAWAQDDGATMRRAFGGTITSRPTNAAFLSEFARALHTRINQLGGLLDLRQIR